MSRKEITVLPSGKGRIRARGKLGLAAAAASLGLYFIGGTSTPAAAPHHRHHGAHATSWDFGSESSGLHRSHRRGGNGETAESKKPEPAKPSGPLILAISIGSQRVTVYDNGTPIAVSQISTGVPGHPTPMGIFSVIQKQRWHQSNIYSGAPMPYMQRITWSGIAMHAGVVPGHPASHGCIRLPERFATRLWGMTKVGARVVITRGDSAPYEISHPRLAGLVEAHEAVREPSATNGQGTAAQSNGSQSNGSEVGTGPVVVATTDGTTPEVTGTEKPHDVSERSASEIGASASPQANGAAGPNKPAEAGRTAEPPKVEPTPAQQIAAALQRPGMLSLFVSRKERKLYVRKGFAPVFETPVAIANPEMPLGTHVFTASRPTKDDGGIRWVAFSFGYDRTASSRAPAKHKGHATRDERPAPLPLTAESLHQAAAQALDRIEIPAEALERITSLVVPGTSLLISDQGLGGETGRDTDFIVVTK